MEKKQFVILGLGVFGCTVAKTLASYDCEVLAIDKSSECVDRIADDVTKAVIGDITDIDFLKSLGVDEFDVGIVGIGNHLEEAILGVMNLKELGVDQVIAKAKNRRFMEVLQKVGADKVIRPEKDMGVKIARSLLRKNITDLIEIDESYCIVEMKVPINWTGKSLIKLNLRKKYNINIIGIRNNETKQIEFTVDPEHVVSMDDHFLIVGNTAQIEQMDFKIKE